MALGYSLDPGTNLPEWPPITLVHSYNRILAYGTYYLDYYENNSGNFDGDSTMRDLARSLAPNVDDFDFAYPDAIYLISQFPLDGVAIPDPGFASLVGSVGGGDMSGIVSNWVDYCLANQPEIPQTGAWFEARVRYLLAMTAWRIVDIDRCRRIFSLSNVFCLDNKGRPIGS